MTSSRCWCDELPFAEVGEHRARGLLEQIGGARQVGRAARLGDARLEPRRGRQRALRGAGEIALDADPEDGGADRGEARRQDHEQLAHWP